MYNFILHPLVLPYLLLDTRERMMALDEIKAIRELQNLKGQLDSTSGKFIYTTYIC